MKLVLESPLSAPEREGFLRNIRYAAWCARVLTLSGHTVWASHLYAPHFLDDRVPAERGRGMLLTDAFTDDTWEHVFAIDHGWSGGMHWAEKRYGERRRTWQLLLKLDECALTTIHGIMDRPCSGTLGAWAAFNRGEWPPCTPGFELGGAL